MTFTTNKARLMSVAASIAIATTLAAPLAAHEVEDPVPETVAEADVDPYIWLEEARSEEALAWVRAENERTNAMLATDPRFEKLKGDALAILDSEDRVPYVNFRPDGLYNFWQDKANPKGLLRRTTLESYKTDNPQWETVLDIDALAAAEGKEWVYKGSSCLAPDYNKCMIALSDGGEDATILREFDYTTKQFIEGGFAIEEKSQGGVSWIDDDTLIVGRDFGEGTLTDSEYPFTARIWRRGTDLAAAPEIFRGESSDVSAGAYLLRDSEATVHAMMAYRGVSFHEREYFVSVADEWVKLDIPSKASPYGIVDGHILYSTDVDWEVDGTTFPADSLIAMELEEWKADPNGASKVLVWAPEDRQTKRGGAITANSLFVGMLDNVVGKVVKFDFEDGEWVSEQVDLPDNATVGIAASSNETDQIMYTVTDFLNPTTLYYSDGSAAPEALKNSPARFDATGMEVEQFEAKSADGTMIPYFVVKPAGMKLDGTTPTLLTGYGGFQVSRLPGYLGTAGKLWVENGGAYVLANLRGGGEFGPGWHQTAIRENKQRTWDDFIAVADDLVARKVTAPRHLGIQGGSQGGLLVGTAFTKRPDLYGAAIVAIPLFDMLRYHEIGRGASWIGEYGDPRIPEQRAWIEGYSPYQKLVEGVDYPAPFFWASTADDRTHPAHARKGAARMKELGQPYYYYEDMTGGHSGGVDNEQRAKLSALQYVYLMQRLKGEAAAATEDAGE
ncbi:prolyl oligopeptidase family serine peptidase [Pontixanthobacter aquaemixtae]|uniref:Prolyl oligopeptidase family serine peptidase n=1 Tax=Pontixanthobacter aquaemixtae TaxID=1958940 RepID=A0A844ZSD1_9SPHN|nr:prolyl oligopeptidase family serine peptidase [Pontixanthobacter aquaemixtae]MXO90755.1 prolyl oligopeptidase family serine peptidase [Pontixanthobacter aquaemixtae]